MEITRYGDHSVHINRMSEGMHGHECSNDSARRATDTDARTQLRDAGQVVPQRPWIHAQGSLLAIHKMGCCSAVSDCVGRCNNCQRWDEYFISGAHTYVKQRGVQSRRTVDDGDRVLGAREAGELGFKSTFKRSYRRDKCRVETLLDVAPLIAGEIGLVQHYRAFADDLADGVDYLG